ncbi:MAG TPA: polyamine aminopropyltransferase [Candidatus Babeliales bacterium]|nr:polyamine aminopropyltransferase [Candidatus Babeliales bacterium]
MIKQSAIALTLLLLHSVSAHVSPEGFYTEWFNHNGLPTMVEIESKLADCKSEYQHIEIYKTTTFGMMMIIDDVIMLTQRDNAAYHEMIAHVPMIAHPNPKRVLVVGGGDGGTLREVLKHGGVEEVVLCEIDQKVIDLSIEYFPEFKSAFEDPRTKIVTEDAAKYVKTQVNSFDVICVDSTDPFGPGEVLFQEPFYKDLKEALTDNGIAVTQSEPMYLYTDLIEKLYKQNSRLFNYANYYFTLVPTYPSGNIGFSFCSKKYDAFENMDENRIAKLKNLRYYNAELHKASFVLPQFLKERLTK